MSSIVDVVRNQSTEASQSCQKMSVETILLLKLSETALMTSQQKTQLGVKKKKRKKKEKKNKDFRFCRLF